MNHVPPGTTTIEFSPLSSATVIGATPVVLPGKTRSFVQSTPVFGRFSLYFQRGSVEIDKYVIQAY